jgi:hypothetical protein
MQNKLGVCPTPGLQDCIGNWPGYCGEYGCLRMKNSKTANEVWVEQRMAIPIPPRPREAGNGRRRQRLLVLVKSKT